MNAASLIRLLALSAIWGASFLFMRIGAPALGAVWLAEWRVGLAAVFLLAVGAVLGKRLQWRANWRHHLVIGGLNSALPFVLFGAAAQTLPASLLSILNATAPIWAAAVGALWTRTALTRRALAGMALGLAGVAMLVGFDPAALRAGTFAAVAMALGGSLSYGIATTYARTARKIEPFANAHGSMVAAALMLAPALPFAPLPALPSATVALAVLALGVVCSGVAYLLYFRLIDDIGAAPALTVTFLVPVFGVIWGHLVLAEPIEWHMLAGAGVVIVGTALLTGFSPAALFARKALPTET